MNDIQIPAGQNMTMRATIIRANGMREELGTVVGGSFPRKVESYLRIKFANFKQWLQS